MFLPIGDSPNLPRTPWLVRTLIVANVLIHLVLWPLSLQLADPSDPNLDRYVQAIQEELGAQRSLGTELAVPPPVRASDLVRYTYGFKPATPSLLDALTSMFLHSGLMHLIGNMLFLWIFGDNVEHRLGRLPFLTAYLGTGLVACFGDAVLRWGSGIPSIGASGAISGVLGLYFAWFPHNRVRVFVFLFPIFMNTVELSARMVLGIYIVAQNLLPFLLSGGAGNVSYGAHLGGFLGGWLLAMILGKGGSVWPGRRRAGPRQPVTAGSSESPFLEALEEGRTREAAALFFGQPRGATKGGISPWEKIRLGGLLEAAGEPRPALAAYQRALADHPTGPGRARAHLGAARVLMRQLGAPTAAYQHLYAALEEEPDPGEAQTARGLLEELRGRARSVPRDLR